MYVSLLSEINYIIIIIIIIYIYIYYIYIILYSLSKPLSFTHEYSLSPK